MQSEGNWQLLTLAMFFGWIFSAGQQQFWRAHKISKKKNSRPLFSIIFSTKIKILRFEILVQFNLWLCLLTGLSSFRNGFISWSGKRTYFELENLSVLSRLSIKLLFWVIKGHSMTTWTQFCPFLTTTYLYVDIVNPER